MDKKKEYIANIVVVFIIMMVFCNGCSNNNEYGYLGFDKTGRQIYIQSLNHYFQGQIKVESEFFDRNIIQRIIK